MLWGDTTPVNQGFCDVTLEFRRGNLSAVLRSGLDSLTRSTTE